MAETTAPQIFLQQRSAGLLVHPTSLPGGKDNGELGAEAFHFVNFLQACGFRIWQMLPLGPTHEDNSPYMTLSVFAGNENLISLDKLADWGVSVPKDVQALPGQNLKQATLNVIFNQIKSSVDNALQHEYKEFSKLNNFWLYDYALFRAIRTIHQSRCWSDWPVELRDRQNKALKDFAYTHNQLIEQFKFAQFVFHKQWHDVKKHANNKGIKIFGDVPIFVAHDSADVWAHREYFELQDDGQPRIVAGVPPDYFSETGQRWGNPLYRWDVMRDNNYSWWIARMRHVLEFYDLVRIDHFRGFESYWEIDAKEKTAVKGKWVKGPGEHFFDVLINELGWLPVVAEDLGTITPEVEQLRLKYHWPGMKILQFAFDGDSKNPYLPHNHHTNYVAYTGTHDNDTTLSWYNSLHNDLKKSITDYFGYSSEAMPWPLIRSALMSVSQLSVIPMQDILGLGFGHRMNTPGVKKGNWSWRFEWAQVSDELPQRLRHLMRMYGR